MATESRIRIWKDSADYIDLDYALLRVHYAESGERIYDRRGLLHRIAPAGFRYPASLTLSLLPEELTRMNAASAGTPRSVQAWLEYYFRAQAELVLFSAGETVAAAAGSFGSSAVEPLSEGAAVSIKRNLGFRVYIDALPPELAGSIAAASIEGPGSGLLDIGLSVIEDGAFGDVTLLASYSAFSPGRGEGA